MVSNNRGSQLHAASQHPHSVIKYAVTVASSSPVVYQIFAIYTRFYFPGYLKSPARTTMSWGLRTVNSVTRVNCNDERAFHRYWWQCCGTVPPPSTPLKQYVIYIVIYAYNINRETSNIVREKSPNRRRYYSAFCSFWPPPPPPPSFPCALTSRDEGAVKCLHATARFCKHDAITPIQP